MSKDFNYNPSYNYTTFESPDKIEVTEKRAPTDDSVRLLQEMEEKVMRKVLDRITVNDNTLNFKCILMDDFQGWNKILQIHYTLNGEEQTFSITVSGDQELIASNSLESIVDTYTKLIIDNLSRNLAELIAPKIINSIAPQVFNMKMFNTMRNR